MNITPEFLEELRSRVPVSEIVSRRVALHKHGREFKGLCPFHNEKTPSFTVVDDKNFYHCFGCGAHGDVITFTMETDGLSFPEAVERLAFQLCWQKAADNAYFLVFLGRQFRAPAFCKGFHRFLPLLDHRLQYRQDLVVVDLIVTIARAGGDVFILQRRDNQAQGRDGASFLVTHRGLQSVAESLPQHRSYSEKRGPSRRKLRAP